MPPKFLRLQLPEGWVSLPPGQYEVGRLGSCQILLDGPKVSRLHARIVVQGDEATVEDLGSANGVFLDGKRIPRGRHPLVEGASMVIGDFVLPVSYGLATTNQPPGRDRATDRPTLVGSASVPGGSVSNPVTTKATALDLLASVAERVLATGDGARAEGILAGRLKEILEGARAGQACDDDLRDRAIRLALSLAGALSSAKWVDYVFDLLSALGALPTAAQSQQLDQLIGRLKYGSSARLREYATQARDFPTSFDKLRVLRQLDEWLAAASRT